MIKESTLLNERLEIKINEGGGSTLCKEWFLILQQGYTTNIFTILSTFFKQTASNFYWQFF